MAHKSGSAASCAGVDSTSDAQLFHRYTRDQAIADGFLVDVTALAATSGLLLPTVLTVAVWEDCVEPPLRSAAVTAHAQDSEARVLALLTAAAAVITASSASTNSSLPGTRYFQVAAADRTGPVDLAITVSMEGEGGSPVLTIMRGDED